MIGEELSSQYLEICKNLRDLSNAEVRFETFSNPSSASPQTGRNASAPDSSVAYGELLKEKRLKMEAYNNLLDRIRELPGCEGFQRTSKFAELKHAAVGGPIVIINCSERRSDVIIVFSDRSPLLIPLDNNFHELMHEIYVGFLDQMIRLEDMGGNASDSISSFLAPITRQLWKKVVRQVVEVLKDNGIPKGSRIWWCPTSFLTSLPFHAAGHGSEWLIDHYISSYTPTLGALISARQAEMSQVSSIPRILVECSN